MAVQRLAAKASRARFFRLRALMAASIWGFEKNEAIFGWVVSFSRGFNHLHDV
jgi:hypothetical protein